MDKREAARCNRQMRIDYRFISRKYLRLFTRFTQIENVFKNHHPLSWEPVCRSQFTGYEYEETMLRERQMS
jgi:hypothetical protein